ncbi:MAG: hypothetical protein AAFP19_27235 [Bacteroidota bacterium]
MNDLIGRDMILLDKTGTSIARLLQIEQSGQFLCGQVHALNMPKGLMELLEEQNELINDMILSLLDEMAEKIDAYGLYLKDTDWLLDDVMLGDDHRIYFKLKPRLSLTE